MFKFGGLFELFSNSNLTSRPGKGALDAGGKGRPTAPTGGALRGEGTDVRILVERDKVHQREDGTVGTVLRFRR